MPEIAGEVSLVLIIRAAKAGTWMFWERASPQQNEFPSGFIKVCKLHYFPIISEILHVLNACSNPWHAIFPGVSRHGALDLCV